MKIPTIRPSSRRLSAHPVAVATSSLAPQACPPAFDGQLGDCWDGSGRIGPGNNFNCTACCALRGAVHWINTGTGAFHVCP